MERWRYARDRLLGRWSEGYGYDFESRKVQTERGEPVLDMVFCEKGRIDGVSHDRADEQGIMRTDACEKGRAVCRFEPYGPWNIVSLDDLAQRVADIPRKKLLFPYSMAMASKCIAEHVRRIFGKISRRGSWEYGPW